MIWLSTFKKDAKFREIFIFIIGEYNEISFARVNWKAIFSEIQRDFEKFSINILKKFPRAIRPCQQISIVSK